MHLPFQVSSFDQLYFLPITKFPHSHISPTPHRYQYDWKLEEAQKNILRTHTTAVSARMLYKIGQQEKFTPVKYFSIDRVFRNESLDATHLAEFHQIEGVVADYNLTLGDLIGVLNAFFRKMGETLVCVLCVLVGDSLKACGLPNLMAKLWWCIIPNIFGNHASFCVAPIVRIITYFMFLPLRNVP